MLGEVKAEARATLEYIRAPEIVRHAVMVAVDASAKSYHLSPNETAIVFLFGRIRRPESPLLGDDGVLP